MLLFIGINRYFGMLNVFLDVRNHMLKLCRFYALLVIPFVHKHEADRTGLNAITPTIVFSRKQIHICSSPESSRLRIESGSIDACFAIFWCFKFKKHSKKASKHWVNSYLVFQIYVSPLRLLSFLKRIHDEVGFIYLNIVLE